MSEECKLECAGPPGGLTKTERPAGFAGLSGTRIRTKVTPQRRGWQHAQPPCQRGRLHLRPCRQQRQGHLQHVLNLAGVVDLDAFHHLRRQILFHVLAVFRGQDDVLHPGPARGQELLLDAAHRQHIAAQRDFAGHRG